MLIKYRPTCMTYTKTFLENIFQLQLVTSVTYTKNILQ